MMRAKSFFYAVAITAFSLAAAAWAEDNVPYIDANGVTQTKDGVTVIDGDNIGTVGSLTGWYLVRGTLTRSTTLTVSGEAHIILEDGSDLTVTGNSNGVGIRVEGSNSLTIYAQSAGSSGKLTSGRIGGSNGSGSGNNSPGASGGTITINGGTVTATHIGGGDGYDHDSSIGDGGGGGNGGTITINGGTVIAEGGGVGSYCEVGIGGGRGGDGGSGSGSGNRFGGSGGNGGTITINGGEVTATGSGNCPGIGGGSGGNGSRGSGRGGNGGNGGTITINGGEVTVDRIGGGDGGSSGSNSGVGSYGGGGATITINGGTLTATGSIGSGGSGGSQNGAAGTFTLSGNAVVFATSGVGDNDGSRRTKGILFDGREGTVYGSVELQKDLELKEGTRWTQYILTVPVSAILTIPSGITLTNNGVITNNGAIIVCDGTLDGTGTLNGNQPITICPELPVITQQPVGGTVTANTAFNLSVTASSGNGTLSYQWHRKILEGETANIFSEDFEGETHSFTLVNGSQTNKWAIGTATANGGTKSAYISNDNGTSNAYATNSSSTVHLYRDITFPASSSPYTLSFNWKGVGEYTFDYLRVYLVETSVTPTAGTMSGSGTALGTYSGNNAWQQATVSIPASNSGTTKRLVFSWSNDGSEGTNPPIAVDNIAVKYTCSGKCDILIPGATSATYAAPTATAGTYSYYVVVTNTVEGNDYGKSVTSNVATLTVEASTPILNTTPPSGLGIVLNGQSLHIFGTSQATPLRIYNLRGNVVMSRTVAPNESVSVSHLPKGVYVVRAGGMAVKVVR